MSTNKKHSAQNPGAVATVPPKKQAMRGKTEKAKGKTKNEEPSSSPVRMAPEKKKSSHVLLRKLADKRKGATSTEEEAMRGNTEKEPAPVQPDEEAPYWDLDLALPEILENFRQSGKALPASEIIQKLSVDKFTMATWNTCHWSDNANQRKFNRIDQMCHSFLYMCSHQLKCMPALIFLQESSNRAALESFIERLNAFNFRQSIDGGEDKEAGRYVLEFHENEFAVIMWQRNVPREEEEKAEFELVELKLEGAKQESYMMRMKWKGVTFIHVHARCSYPGPRPYFEQLQAEMKGTDRVVAVGDFNFESGYNSAALLGELNETLGNAASEEAELGPPTMVCTDKRNDDILMRKEYRPEQNVVVGEWPLAEDAKQLRSLLASKYGPKVLDLVISNHRPLVLFRALEPLCEKPAP